MFDLMSAARAAVFRALEANVTDGTPVFDDIPQDTPPPFIKVGAIDSENQSDKADQLELITAEVIVVYRGEDRGVLLSMMHAARNALDGRPLDAPGAAFQPPHYLKGSASDASDGDGITFAGILNFEFLAEPA